MLTMYELSLYLFPTAITVPSFGPEYYICPVIRKHYTVNFRCNGYLSKKILINE